MEMRYSKVRYILVAVLIAISSDVMSAATVEQADSAYSRGDYAEAIAQYNDVAKREGISSELFYNMGNAYAKGGDYGNALVFYLKSLRLDPSNHKARANAAYIESKVYDANRAELKGKKLSIDADSPTFFTSVREYIMREHLSDTWAVWAAVAFVLFVICAALYVFSRAVLVRKVGFFGGFVCLGISVITLVFSFMAASYRSDEGVVTGGKVHLYSDASAGSKENPVALTRGTRMTVLDTFPAVAGEDANRDENEGARWYKVRLNSDFVGWLPASDFRPVDM